MVMGAELRYIEHLPPDPMSAMFWLKNPRSRKLA
jgi:hypothetical protein